MSRITIDAKLATQLQNLGDFAELCDPSGKVLGRFIPSFDPAEWECVTPPASDEELDRRAKSDEWYTTEQVLDHLKNLEK